MIPRDAYLQIKASMFKGKVLHIPGARQVGKTTILKAIAGEDANNTLWLNGDDVDVRNALGNTSTARLGMYIGDKKLIIIDEAQRIPNIGITLKQIVDNFPDKQVIATGSSAFELANNINEPLTGRKIEIFLYPLSFAEMVSHHGLFEEERRLEHRLVYGYYPEVVTSAGMEVDILKRLSDAYLYKDIFTLENIKKPVVLEKLLQALAFQVGSEVSINELSQTVGSDNKTVERYIDLLEKAYIIFRLNCLSRNLRNELKKSRKIYFYDNGIRNAVIRNFNSTNLRQDIGVLWENFLVSERAKALQKQKLGCNKFFWRNHNQQEIDYIEEYDGVLHAYEFKWNTTKKYNFPQPFLQAYTENETQIINRDNYLGFITQVAGI